MQHVCRKGAQLASGLKLNISKFYHVSTERFSHLMCQCPLGTGHPAREEHCVEDHTKSHQSHSYVGLKNQDLHTKLLTPTHTQKVLIV